MRATFWFLPLTLGLSTAMLSCRADVGASMVEIQRAVAPDTSCLYALGNPSALRGFYDPTVDALGYQLVLLLRNNLQSRDTNPVLMDGTVNVRNRVNNLSLVGFEGCWFNYEGPLTQFGTYQEGALIDCATLPGQSASIPASGSMDEGTEGQTLTLVNVLTPAHLKQVYGDAFAVDALPQRGFIAGVSGEPNRFAVALEDARDTASRSPAWGKFPASQSAAVVVQLRAVLTAQSGESVRSGWFNYMIEVCPGCVSSACGDLVQKPCPGLCPDGSACVANACTVNGQPAPCPVVEKMSGVRPSYTGTTVCAPAQGFSPPDCTLQKVGC